MDVSHHGGAAYYDEVAHMNGTMSNGKANLAKESPDNLTPEVYFQPLANSQVINGHLASKTKVFCTFCSETMGYERLLAGHYMTASHNILQI